MTTKFNLTRGNFMLNLCHLPIDDITNRFINNTNPTKQIGKIFLNHIAWYLGYYQQGRNINQLVKLQSHTIV